MLVTITIIRYPKKYIAFAVLAMAIHHIPLWLNREISFYKLLGCGKNGTFDKHPDWQQWGILTARTNGTNASMDSNLKANELIDTLYGRFIDGWFQFFNCEKWTIFLSPLEGHGKWDGKTPFDKSAQFTAYNGPIATLTRATIRLSKLNAFWSNVGAAANEMSKAKGFITSVGIGELPYIKQATFSIWESKEDMKTFAYKMHQHADIIRKTRAEQWYSEELFMRFVPLKTFGTIRGVDPLDGKLYI